MAYSTSNDKAPINNKPSSNKFLKETIEKYERLVFWGVISFLLFMFIQVFSPIMWPFYLSAALVFLFKPLWKSLRRLGLNNLFSTLIVIGSIISLIALGVIYIIPIIYKQVIEFFRVLPEYQHYFMSNLVPYITEKAAEIDPSLADHINDFFTNIIKQGFSRTFMILNNLWQYTMATFNLVSLLFILPFIMFFMMRDWNKFFSEIDRLIPYKHKKTFRRIGSEIEELLSAYIRGQLNISLLLCIYYSAILSMLGLNFAILLAIISGFLIILPYIGPFISIAAAIILTYLQFGLDYTLLYVAITYITGQFLEGVFITPNIIGERIGLHPLLVIFIVFAGGVLFGFVGIIFAIPMGGVLSIIIKHVVSNYKRSKFYKT
jgi:putative permease